MVDEFKLRRKTRFLLSDASGWAARSTSPWLSLSRPTCQLQAGLSSLAPVDEPFRFWIFPASSVCVFLALSQRVEALGEVVALGSGAPRPPSSFSSFPPLVEQCPWATAPASVAPSASPFEARVASLGPFLY